MDFITKVDKIIKQIKGDSLEGTIPKGFDKKKLAKDQFEIEY